MRPERKYSSEMSLPPFGQHIWSIFLTLLGLSPMGVFGLLKCCSGGYRVKNMTDPEAANPFGW